MRNVKLLLILLIVVIALVLVFAVLLPKGPKIIVRHEGDVKEIIYTLEDNSISLTTYETELNKDILHLRSKSDLPLKLQVKIVSKILKQVPKEQQFRTFFIGRLLNAFGTDKTMSERLSLAASQSPLWDKEKGRPRSGHENKCVKEIANQVMIYPELREMFAKHGYEIEVSSVEKVLVDPHTKLPFDCMTWFSLSKPLIHIANGYWKDDTKVYWKWRTIEEPRGPIEYTVKEVKGADPKTFRFLDERIEGVWGKDRHGIYFFEQKIEGADIDTWQPLDWDYSKDKNYVYKGAQRIIGADPNTFTISEPPS